MDINTLYKNILFDIYDNGKIKYSRNIECKEISPYIITLDNICDNIITLKGFETNLQYANEELNWYLYGNDNINYSEKIKKVWNKYSENDLVNSNYGTRIFGKHNLININQYSWCKNKLIEDKDSRQAIININSYFDKNKITKDFPCCLDLQFLIDNDKLNMIVHMRSNDIYFGFRNDLFCFTEIQKLMANDLNLKYGKYIHIVNSLHLYKEQYYKVEVYKNDT